MKVAELGFLWKRVEQGLVRGSLDFPLPSNREGVGRVLE